MLTIRQEQMEALAAANEQLFERRLLAQLKIHFPQRVATLLSQPDGEAKLLQWMRNRFAQAATYGIEYEGDYAVFIMLIMENQRLRAENPMDNGKFLAWTRPLLERENSTGQVKIALIEHRIEKQAQTDQRAARLVFIINALREEFG